MSSNLTGSSSHFKRLVGCLSAIDISGLVAPSPHQITQCCCTLQLCQPCCKDDSDDSKDCALHFHHDHTIQNFRPSGTTWTIYHHRSWYVPTNHDVLDFQEHWIRANPQSATEMLEVRMGGRSEYTHWWEWLVFWAGPVTKSKSKILPYFMRSSTMSTLLLSTAWYMAVRDLLAPHLEFTFAPSTNTNSASVHLQAQARTLTGHSNTQTLRPSENTDDVRVMRTRLASLRAWFIAGTQEIQHIMDPTHMRCLLQRRLPLDLNKAACSILKPSAYRTGKRTILDRHKGDWFLRTAQRIQASINDP